MDRTVVALFDNMSDAQNAVQELVNNGFSRDHISLVATNRETGDTATTAGAADGAAAGAGVGAVLGGLAGLLVGIGALAIPGIGPIIAAGPLAAALAGAGIGAATGGVIGALVDAGVPEEEAEFYAEGVRRGGTLVTATVSEGMMSRALDIMNRHNPVDVKQRASSWRESGWSGFDTDTSRDTGYTRTTSTGYTGTGAGRMEQDREGSTGYHETQGTGTGSGRSGAGSGSFSSGTGFSGTGSDLGSRETRDTAAGGSSGTGSFRSFTDDEDYFRQDFQRNFGSTGHAYNRYQPAYRFGYELANNEQYRNRNWSDIESDVRRDWERRYPDNAWLDFKDSVRRGWERVKEGVRDTFQDDTETSRHTYGQSGQGMQQGTMGSAFDDTYFRQDYQRRFANTGYGYERYQPAYRYGYELGNNRQYRNRNWSDIEMDVRRDWEQRHPDSAWEQFKDAVRHGWERMRSGVRDALD